MVDAETMKWASLAIFTLQNAAFVLLMRASKVLSPTHYNTAVAVLVTEILKLPFSFLLLAYEKGGPCAAVAHAARTCGSR